MAWEIVCSKCGQVLHSGFDLRSPGELLKPFGSKCKRCGTKLLTDTFKIEVVKFEGSVSISLDERTDSRAREIAPPAVAARAQA